MLGAANPYLSLYSQIAAAQVAQAAQAAVVSSLQMGSTFPGLAYPGLAYPGLGSLAAGSEVGAGVLALQQLALAQQKALQGALLGPSGPGTPELSPTARAGWVEEASGAKCVPPATADATAAASTTLAQLMAA